MRFYCSTKEIHKKLNGLKTHGIECESGKVFHRLDKMFMQWQLMTINSNPFVTQMVKRYHLQQLKSRFCLVPARKIIGLCVKNGRGPGTELCNILILIILSRSRCPSTHEVVLCWFSTAVRNNGGLITFNITVAGRELANGAYKNSMAIYSIRRSQRNCWPFVK